LDEAERREWHRGETISVEVRQVARTQPDTVPLPRPSIRATLARTAPVEDSIRSAPELMTGAQTEASECVREPSASCRGDKSEADRSAIGNHRSGRQCKTGGGCPAFFYVAGREVGRTGAVVLLSGRMAIGMG
jgi:hypothetical protein